MMNLADDRLVGGEDDDCVCSNSSTVLGLPYLELRLHYVPVHRLLML